MHGLQYYSYATGSNSGLRYITLVQPWKYSHLCMHNNRPSLVVYKTLLPNSTAILHTIKKSSVVTCFSPTYLVQYHVHANYANFHTYVYVAVPGRKRTLFSLIYLIPSLRLKRDTSELPLRVELKHSNCQCIYTAHLSPALDGSSEISRF